MKKQPRRGRLFAVLLVVLLLIALIGGWFYLNQHLRLSGVIPSTPILVNVLGPANGLEIGSGEPVPVMVEAVSDQPLVSMEVWLDGRLFGRQAVDSPGLEPVQAAWTWAAGSPGIHVLFARARDAAGRTGQSMQVILTVVGISPGSVAAIKGESLADIAGEWNSPIEDFAAANPGLDPQQPLAKGQPVVLPGGGGGSGNGGPPPAGPTQNPAAPLSPVLFWLEANLLPPASLPTQPSLAVVAENCTARLYITPAGGTETGFVVYRWRTGEGSYSQIAFLGKAKAGVPILYEDPTPLSPGVDRHYYVSAFNSRGENPSGVVVTPPGPCAPAGPQGLVSISWSFTPSQGVTQSYCYQSFGNGAWRRMPANPFTFWPDGGYTQSFLAGEIPQSNETIMLDCWGWEGGALKYLGRGQAGFNLDGPARQMEISTEGFTALGTPQMKALDDAGGYPKDANLKVPAPYAMRATTNGSDCTSHAGGDSVAGLICDGLLGNGLKTQTVAIWEWTPRINWPCAPGQTCPVWVNKIDGYYIYQGQNGPKIQVIANPDQKVTAFPLAWAGASDCYGIQAFANLGPAGEMVSDMSVYCLSEAPLNLKTLALQPSAWLSVASRSVYSGDSCGGTQWPWPPADADVVAGISKVNSDDCGMNRTSAAGVKFDISPSDASLLANVAVVKATFNFSLDGSAYDVFLGDGTKIATNELAFCPVNLGTANFDWTGLNSDHGLRFMQPPRLDIPASMTPFASIYGMYGANVDVTPIVLDWLKNAANNNGFIVYPDPSRYGYYFYGNAELQTCMSFFSGFELDIQYYPPPGNK
jgi:hypothetical protein